MISLDDAPLAPRALTFLATFNDRERAEIARDPELRACIRSADPSTWAARMDEHRQAQAAAIAARAAHLPVDAEGMRRQALHDVRAATASYAELTDGRRNGLFPGVCKVARYIVHGVLTEAEFRSAWMDAGRANGALAKHGPAALALAAVDGPAILRRAIRLAASWGPGTTLAGTPP